MAEVNELTPIFTDEDQAYMARAIELAKIAESHNEIPVGAVVVHNGEIIGEGYNRSIMDNDPSAHAEMIAIRAAGVKLENYRLIDCTLYVTLEPCPMCAGLLVHSRINKIIFATKDEKTGAAGSVFNLVQHGKLNHQLEIAQGLMQVECATLLSDFFKRRRKEIKAAKKAQKQQTHDKSC